MLTKFSETVNSRVFVFRIIVTSAFLITAGVLGALIYFTLEQYERNEAGYRFDNIAKYAQVSLTSSFKLMDGGLSAVAKNMGHVANSSAWPNVIMPGFYDVAPSHRDSLSLGNMVFLPIVLPSERLSFENFMYDYYSSEPEIGPTGGISSLGKGIYSLGPQGLYFDITGETTTFSSPNKILTPLVQMTFNNYFQKHMLSVNMHNLKTFGPGQDYLMECSRHHNYNTVYDFCSAVTELELLPFGTTLDAVTDLHTAFIQPIFRNQNASELVGFISGGFNWHELLLDIFRYNQEGIDIVVTNGATTFTMVTDDAGLRRKSFDDAHDSKYDNKVRRVGFFQQPDGSSAYTVSIYPTDHFYQAYHTDFSAYATAACVVVLVLCAATFLLYDYYMRKATAANEAVLETKRRFVRFISHEIRTPLNAVHLGLEALTAEVQKAMKQAVSSGDSAMFQELLRSWLELTTDMMANSNSAENVLDDLLNYDKIEIGALNLVFAFVPIWDIVRSKVVASMPQMSHKNVFFSMKNLLAADEEHSCKADLEQQVFSQFQVIGDSGRLAQVVRTLINHAVKFTPCNGNIELKVERIEGGIPHFNLVLPAESVQLLEQPRAGSIRISVTDSGAGLSQDEIAAIAADGVKFDTNELLASKGSGLGLFITKGIVEQHGGTFTVTSAGVHAGTTFTVELPLFLLPVQAPASEENFIARAAHSLMPTRASITNSVQSKDSAAGSNVRVSPEVSGKSTRAPLRNSMLKSLSQSALPSVPTLPPPFASEAPDSTKEEPKRILVVDDVASNRKMLMRILTSKGYVCEQAEDGQQAIDVYRASLAAGNAFDAITMDFEMPVMNGPTATGYLRAMECTIPIIGVTGNILPEDIKHFKTQGATEVMGKPLNLSRFQEFV